MRVVRDLGEFGLIERVRRLASRWGAPARGWVLGSGDDAAVLRPPRGHDLVVSTDALLEGTHFRWDTEHPASLGRRALGAALSDLAAMGARPLGVLVALELPGGLELRRLDGLARGLAAATRRHGCPLVGGNVTRARRTGLTLTVLGAVRRGRMLTRSAARPGDRLYVTGRLGAMALAVARARREGIPVGVVPEPRLAAGRALAELPGHGACIDISDGLLADLGHLLEASGVGAELWRERVPRARGLASACARLGLDAERLVLCGGEDYELLFTLRPRAPRGAVLRRRLGVPVAEIGRIVARGAAPPAVAPGPPGWRHF